MAISKEDTARSYKGTVIGGNMVVSLNLKWLVQIITLCAMLVYSYYRIEMRIVELEDKFIQADTHIEDCWQNMKLKKLRNEWHSKNK